MKTNKKLHKAITEENSIEAVRHVAKDVSGDLKSIGSGVVNELLDNILIGKRGGDLVAGQEIDLRRADKPEKAPRQEAAMNYFREVAQAEKVVRREDEQTLKTQIEEIQIEIKRLIASSTELKVQFKEVVVEQRLEKPGKYHKTFYEWFLSMLRNWRQSVEDASAWMTTIKSKKTSRSYWSMFKKHGTSFGLSGERVVSTQVG
jgi:hypothetical protein